MALPFLGSLIYRCFKSLPLAGRGILRYFVNPLILTRDPRNVEHMLKKNFDNYPKGVLAKRDLGGLFSCWVVPRHPVP